MGWEGWLVLLTMVIVANTLITLTLYPSKKPDYWWLPGAWIWFKLRDLVLIPVWDYLYPETIQDPNKRRRLYSPPRIA